MDDRNQLHQHSLKKVEDQVWTDEPDGAYRWRTCKKNPGHSQFIRVSDFTFQHLPWCYDDEDLFECVKAQADLTVRVRVNYTSRDRPDGYIFSNCRGTSIPHTGSGRLLFKKIYPVEITDSDCSCPECIKTPLQAGRSWWEVLVYTAQHVVYGDEEACQTIVDVYYDDDKTENIRHLYGMSADTGKLDGFCILKCVTHDKELVDKLYDRNLSLHVAEGKLISKYKNPMGKGFPTLAIVTSHPHGCSKHITIGKCIERKIVRERGDGAVFTYYIYDAPTCLGCSGAPVLTLGFGVQHVDWHMSNFHHIHSAGQGSNINKSGVFVDKKAV